MKTELADASNNAEFGLGQSPNQVDSFSSLKRHKMISGGLIKPTKA